MNKWEVLVRGIQSDGAEITKTIVAESNNEVYARKNALRIAITKHHIKDPIVVQAKRLTDSSSLAALSRRHTFARTHLTAYQLSEICRKGHA